MIRVLCPTGCGPIRRPYARRAEPVRCGNCTAWIAASPNAEDASVVDGVLLARPGERPPAPRARARLPWRVILPAAALIAALAAAIAVAAAR